MKLKLHELIPDRYYRFKGTKANRYAYSKFKMIKKDIEFYHFNIYDESGIFVCYKNSGNTCTLDWYELTCDVFEEVDPYIFLDCLPDPIERKHIIRKHRIKSLLVL